MDNPARLYHSFPRPSVSDARKGVGCKNEAALRSLATMIDYGLVLTPQELHIPPNPDSSRELPSSEGFQQIRACFTLMNRSELFIPSLLGGGSWAGVEGSHQDVFGDFALGLHPTGARELGMVPVNYFYRPVGIDGDENLELSLGQETLFRLRELHILLRALAHLEAKAAPANIPLIGRDELENSGFSLDSEQDVRNAIDYLEPEVALELFDCINTDRVPAWNLADWIAIILNSYQIADSRDEDESLQYYQQREWRIVRLSGPAVRCYALSPKYSPNISSAGLDSGKLRNRLNECNPRFFTDQRLEECWLVTGTEKRRFFDYVVELLVPREMVEQVSRIFECRYLKPNFGPPRLVEYSAGEAFVFERTR